MKDKAKLKQSQLFNFVEGSYLERTSRPLYSLVFLLPFIIFYELGTIFINTNILRHYWQGRVVAFSWLQIGLEHLGFSHKFGWLVTPLAVIVLLLALHLASRKPWYLYIPDMIPMLIECVLFAIPLIVLGLFLSGSYGSSGYADNSGTVDTAFCSVLSAVETGGSGTTRVLADIVTGIGAGIYEELVFRLILICLLMVVFQDLFRIEHRNAVIMSVLVSAALFSAYHHVDFFTGELYQRAPFSWAQFSFRTIAGVYFAIIYAARGFGITAGTHAFYDVIATFINVIFFAASN